MKYSRIPLHKVSAAAPSKSQPVLTTAARTLRAVKPKFSKARPNITPNAVSKTKLPFSRPFIRHPSPKSSISPPRVNAANPSAVSAARVNVAKLSSATRINVVKLSAVTAVQHNHTKKGNPQQALKDKGVIDSGCSRHMTENMSYLSDFEELNGGYVSFGGNPKGGKIIGKVMSSLPPADQRHSWLRCEVEGYTPVIVHSYEQRLETIWSESVNRQVYVSHAWRRPFEIRAPLVREFILEFLSTYRMKQEMAEDGFRAYWVGSDRLIPDKGGLRDYWFEISSGIDLLGPAPSYVLIQDPVRRLCHRMIAYIISGKGQAPKKTTTAGAHEADEAGPVDEEVVVDIPAPAEALPPPPPAPQPRTMSQRIERVEEELMDVSGQTYQPFDLTLIGLHTVYPRVGIRRIVT
uniref:Ribonuclease H-like domain-containing protein n=1 Tax=Tanacetum cinerariifolium TaxID=118510 RepID=A0A699H8H2_TANCI|nr:ribonuclease H-like domain-containing protein [Tanacetum cinerariifolium]